MYEKLGHKKRYLYITRVVDDDNKLYIDYQGWCPKGDHFGCMDDDRELKPAEFFIGYIEDQPDKSLCDIDVVPTQYGFDPCFGDPGSGENSVCPQEKLPSGGRWYAPKCVTPGVSAWGHRSSINISIKIRLFCFLV